jgi:Uncharacterized protein conserved in bacteria (DUF2147)
VDRDALAWPGGARCRGGRRSSGQWKTVDEKSGAVESVVEIYDQGGKLFGKIANLTKPTDDQGKPKLCTECTGADKDQPILGLIIIKDLGADGGRHDSGPR